MHKLFEKEFWWEKLPVNHIGFAANFTIIFTMNELTPKGLEKALSQPSVSNVIVQVCIFDNGV